MARLAFFGDTHGDISTMYKLVEKYETERDIPIDGIVQVGDLGVYTAGTEWHYYWNGIRKATKPTLVIMGNHEEPQAVNRWSANPDKVENMKLLQDGTIENFLGVRIGGIWGNFSPISYKDPERVIRHRMTGESPRIAMHINRLAVENLLAQPGSMDVLITHDSARSTFPEFFRNNRMDPTIADILGLVREEINHAQGCPGFDDLLEKFKPRAYFYGHLHVSDYKRLGETKVQCLQCIQYTKDGDCMEVLEF